MTNYFLLFAALNFTTKKTYGTIVVGLMLDLCLLRLLLRIRMCPKHFVVAKFIDLLPDLLFSHCRFANFCSD